jgi:CDP-glucose 4,6-dehydratase
MTTGWLSAFRGVRVLVTGDTGFKGSWLALWLHDVGAVVTGMALPPEDARSHFSLLSLDRLIRHVDADIRDYASVRGVFERAQPEIVLHLAAQPLVRRSYLDPKATFDTNVGGSVNVLEAVRHTSSVRALVYITSDKCYRNKNLTRGYVEQDELGGRDPYSASKACAELAFAAYAESFFNSRTPGVASTRAGNVIGGGDWSQDRIVPDSITALMAGRPIVLRNPESTRPWQHVLEPLSGYLMLAATLMNDPVACHGAWNFGPAPEAAWTVGALTHQIIEAWGGGSFRVERPQDAPHEDRLLSLNADKARLALGWRPRWSVERTVAETVLWYKAVADGCPAIDVSRKQIAAYTACNGDTGDRWRPDHAVATDS